MTSEPIGFEFFVGIYPEAELLSEANHVYVLVPQLKFQSGGQGMELDVLLCLTNHSGYATRLFLEQQIPNKGNNWTVHQILGRSWYSWSWQGIQAHQPLIDILGNHLRALQ